MRENIFMSNQRIIILQGLEQAAGRCLSNEMLQRLLREYGHSLSLAQINNQIEWLERRGYVQAERLSNKALILVHIKRSGIDVALGNTRTEGIDSPLEY